MSLFRLVCITVACALLAACQTTSFSLTDKFQRRSDSVRVLLMPADVELSSLTAGGIEEPRADWTEAGRRHVDDALGSFLAGRRAVLVRHEPGSEGAEAEQQLFKLHQAVGMSILLHQYQTPLQLPTKTSGFDWSLGDGAARLRDTYDADYALFVYLRDSYSTGGRAAVIFVGLLLGVAIPGGAQVGFASLVDLRTGDVVWFNRLARGAGDLRQPEPAVESVAQLMSDFPQ